MLNNRPDESLKIATKRRKALANKEDEMTLDMGTGRLLVKYPGQMQAQDIVADVDACGNVYIHYNPEIGNAVPMDIGNGIKIRFTLAGITTKTVARRWYRDNLDDLKIMLRGMDSSWNGSNYVGTLTPAAEEAKDRIDSRIYKREWEQS